MSEVVVTDEEFLNGVLSQRKPREEKVREILAWFAPGKHHVAYAHNTHAPIETVEIYGPVIGVDANGHAAEVRFPDGYVTE
jgi:hypothetical protein